jgi:general secretion pathway protein J
MIALLISAMIAVMAFQTLDSADRGSARTNEVLAEINRLDRAWQIIAADMRHVLPPIQNDPRTFFVGETLKSSGENASEEILMFKRRGWVNFANRVRSDLQIVSYRVEKGQLWRDFMPENNWLPSDIDWEDDAFQQLLLDDVTDVQLRFLHQGALASRGKSVLESREYSGDWLQKWPDSTLQGAIGLPLAIQITIDIKGVGPSVRLFALPEQ